ncbi:Armadillo-like helical [Artemisia annua]|uniref:Armadillo-like helical n=1 Tax=Artemisia annua TaxID=35608 RepID=A0A2U1KD86_ARTAN|nr:Armadillo-like helical [Artemisia annua]
MVPNSKVPERKLFVQNLSPNHEALKGKGETQRQHEPCSQDDVVISASRKPKAKKKASDATFLPTKPDDTERQDAAVEGFCEVLEDLCRSAEISVDDREEGEAEWLHFPVGKIKTLVKEVMSIRANKILHLVPVVLLERTLKVLDHQIHSAEGLSINQSEYIINILSFPRTTVSNVNEA